MSIKVHNKLLFRLQQIEKENDKKINMRKTLEKKNIFRNLSCAQSAQLNIIITITVFFIYIYTIYISNTNKRS